MSYKFQEFMFFIIDEKTKNRNVEALFNLIV